MTQKGGVGRNKRTGGGAGKVRGVLAKERTGMKIRNQGRSRDERDDGGRRGFLKKAGGMLLAFAGLSAATGKVAGDAVDEFARKAAARVAGVNGVRPLYYCQPSQYFSCPHYFTCDDYGEVTCSTFDCGLYQGGTIPVFECRRRWGDMQFTCTGGFDCDNFACGANGVFDCAEPQICGTYDHYCNEAQFRCAPQTEYVLLSC